MGDRITLRRYQHPDGTYDPDLLDDVVVNDVSMFRAEQMADNVWWVACYLAGTDERVTFWFSWNYRTRNLEMACVERPRPIPEAQA